MDEEKQLLDAIAPKAKRGEITTKAEVKQTVEQKVGHKVHKTTIYRLLRRHQWGKRKPRPIHPKADLEQQDEFKANFSSQVQQILQQRDPTDTRPVLVMVSDEGRFGRTGEIASGRVSTRLETHCCSPAS